MTLPAIEKTWQFVLNDISYIVGDEYTNLKTMLLRLKNILTTFGSNPWVVTGSSDGVDVASGMDGVDRWLDTGDIVTANSGSNHSWIVLKQAGISANYEILIDMSYTSTRYCTIQLGLGGFTGGSRTTRPSNTAFMTLNNQTYWYPNVVANWILQVMQSTDGECTRFILMQDRIPVMFWLFDKPKNPVAGWTDPAIAMIRGNSGSGTQCDLPPFNDGGYFKARPNGVASSLYTSLEGYGAATVAEQLHLRNQITNEFEIWSPALVSETAGTRGRLCEVYDMWFGCISSNSTGGWTEQTYPNDSTRQFWQVDDVILPWPGTPTVPGPIPIVAV
jgi:hypothetical protein